MIASIITALYLLGYMTAANASNFLFVSGVMLIVAEIALATFWIVGFNGLLALYVGYAIRTGDQTLFGLPMDWSVVFGIAFIELIVIVASVVIIIRHRRHKVTTGVESMIGHKAKVVSWDGTKGQVSVQGELWQAKSDQPMNLNAGENVTISAVEGLVVTVKS